MLHSGMPDFYIPGTAHLPDKNKDCSFATVLCDTSNFIKVLAYLEIFREVLPFLQVFLHFCKILNSFIWVAPLVF